MDQVQAEKKSIQTKNGTIFYFARIISTEQPTVMLLHGLSANHLTWNDLAEKLAKAGYNTIAPDLRGHGLSDKTRKRSLYALGRMKEDIEAIRVAEKIVAIHLLGYSWGGYIALDYAAAYADRTKSLALISTNFRNPLAYSPFAFLAPLARIGLIGLGYLLWWHRKKRYYYFSPDNNPGYWKSTFAGLSTMPLAVNFWMLAEVLGLDFRKSAGNIACPTLIIYGTHDSFVTEREMKDLARAIPRSTVAAIDESSHYLATHHRDIIADHILSFYRHIM